MGAFMTMIVLCIAYYIVYKYYPEYIKPRYNYYFGGIIVIYLIIQYLFTFEYPFVYKTFKNIYGANNQPLYSNGSAQSNSDLFYEQNPNHDIKTLLAQKQGYRCHKCGNIMGQDYNEYPLTYTIPLQSGGENSINNLSVVCPSCFEFH